MQYNKGFLTELHVSMLGMKNNGELRQLRKILESTENDLEILNHVWEGKIKAIPWIIYSGLKDQNFVIVLLESVDQVLILYVHIL